MSLEPRLTFRQAQRLFWLETAAELPTPWHVICPTPPPEETAALLALSNEYLIRLLEKRWPARHRPPPRMLGHTTDRAVPAALIASVGPIASGWQPPSWAPLRPT